MAQRNRHEITDHDDVQVVMNARPTGRGVYSLDVDGYRRAEGLRFEVLVSRQAYGTLYKDTSLPTSTEWVAQYETATKSTQRFYPTLSAALYGEGKIVARRLANTTKGA